MLNVRHLAPFQYGYLREICHLICGGLSHSLIFMESLCLCVINPIRNFQNSSRKVACGKFLEIDCEFSAPLHPVSEATIPNSCQASVKAKLTCAVWCCARPCAICQTLACRRTDEEISFHTRIHDGVRKSCVFHSGNAGMSRGTWVPTLHSCNTEEKREDVKVRGVK